VCRFRYSSVNGCAFINTNNICDCRNAVLYCFSGAANGGCPSRESVAAVLPPPPPALLPRLPLAAGGPSPAASANVALRLHTSTPGFKQLVSGTVECRWAWSVAAAAAATQARSGPTQAAGTGTARAPAALHKELSHLARILQARGDCVG
jgi:hypothetical protein